MSEEELFCKLFPEYVVNGKPLSPYFDLFESGYEQSEKQIAELEKANEWHYVKDGDLPSDRHGHVVINQDYDKVTIRNGRFEHLDGGKADVIAWKEIVLPKESE